jgi:hypothetical protein
LRWCTATIALQRRKSFTGRIVPELIAGACV